MSISKNKELVTLSNELARASYRLSVNEFRLLLVAMAQMLKDDNEVIDSNKPYYITKDDFIRFGVAPNNVAHEIRSACSDLMDRKVFIDTPVGDYEFHWISNVLHFKSEKFEELKRNYPNSKYDEEFIESLRLANLLDSLSVITEGDDNVVARVVFSKEIIPYISQLKKAFIQLNLEDLAGFNSFYSFRVYMLMMQWRDTGLVMIKLDEFRQMLDLTDKYPAIKDLKKRVLDTAINEISEKSPYTADYEVTDKNGKSGKGIKLTHLKIKFKPKAKAIEGKTKSDRDPNTIDWVNGQTDYEANTQIDPALSWRTKGLSDGQIKKIGCNLREFVDANSNKIAPNDRRDYAPIFDDWKPLLKDPKTATTFHLVQELLDRQRV